MNELSLKRLSSVHPDLQAVVKLADELYQAKHGLMFVVTEGIRTLERQKVLVATGKSKTMKSRHLTGHAVDLAVWEDRDKDKVVDADELSWKFAQYKQLADVVKEAAKKLGVALEWGGDWTSFKDGPHFQLTWAAYPK